MSSSLVLHACTTATRAQLPAARVLCHSLRRHHPDAEITVLVVDDVDGAARAPSGVRVVTPDAVAPPEVLARVMMMCTSTELAGAVTPYRVLTRTRSTCTSSSRGRGTRTEEHTAELQ